jgi:hypothetical protein
MKTSVTAIWFVLVLADLQKAVGRTARSFSHTSGRGVLFKQSRSQPRPMVPADEVNAGDAHAATIGFRHLQMLRA